MDRIYLAGSDDVRTAGHTMQAAAEEMRRAASTIETALERHRQCMDDWLVRFREALRAMEDGR